MLVLPDALPLAVVPLINICGIIVATPDSDAHCSLCDEEIILTFDLNLIQKTERGGETIRVLITEQFRLTQTLVEGRSERRRIAVPRKTGEARFDPVAELVLGDGDLWNASAHLLVVISVLTDSKNRCANGRQASILRENAKRQQYEGEWLHNFP